MKPNKKLKLLQIIYKLEVGGAEKIVCALAQKFNTVDSQCDVVSFKGGLLKQQLVANGVKVHVLGKRSKVDIFFLFRLYTHIRKNGYDILHTHTFSPNMWGRIIGRLSGVSAIITTEHTMASHKKGWQKAVDRALYFGSDRIICVSNEIKRSLMMEAGIPEKKIEVIHNGVERHPVEHRSVEDARALKRNLGLTGDLPIFISVGRLSEPKGYKYLLEAIALIASKEPIGQFLIVGDGPLRADLERRSKRLKLDHSLVFCGFRNDINAILQIADIFVSSSVREGFPVSLLEAMGEGKPIVATSVGGNNEAIVPGSTGLLVPPRDPKALADAIRYMAEHRTFRAACGNEAQKVFTKRFTLETMIKQTGALYKKTLKAKHAN